MKTKETIFLTICVSLVLVVFGIFLILKFGQSDPVSVMNSPKQANTVVPVEELVDHSTPAPLYITTMTHMEGVFKDDKDQALFLKHVEDLRWAMDLFDEYGAKLTIESEQSFATANIRWNQNFLQEVVDAGHGVGTHADFGASGKPLSLEELTQRFVENKKLVDQLVGADKNVGVSGGTGPTDWVLAASGAGFKFMDGVTGFGYLSMPLQERPAGWTDEYIRQTAYHDPIPTDFSQRIYPIALADAKDLVPDKPGVLVVMGGDIGELASLAEGRSNCAPKCTLTSEDVDKVVEAIDEALRIQDPQKVARINLHIPLTLFTRQNEELLRYFLDRIKTYTASGDVLWATQLGSYQGFVDWNE